MRPLTAADRPPQVGDVLLMRGKAALVNACTETTLETKSAQAHGMLISDCRWWREWRYIWRADGGPITTEED